MSRPNFSYRPSIDYVDQVRRAAPTLGIDAAALAAWEQDLFALENRGAFYFSIHWVYVTAEK
jgi:hypothetical protein